MSGAAGGGDVARFSLVLPGPEERCAIAVGSGLVRSLAELVATHAPAHRYAVIADETVAELHGARVTGALGDGAQVGLYTFPGGEATKTPSTWATLVESLARDGLGRDTCVVGLGGGVTCDLAGFVAATFLRGVPLVQVPTSLLAMVDAAIGGKTGVDLAAGKNLAGAFWQPRLVVIDTAFLATLPPEERRAGLAEVVKHGVIADADGFAWLEENAGAVLGGDAGALRRVVADSVRVKSSFVAGDAREAGARAALNFGHTIGHALEGVSAYSIPHGPAVAAGMVVEARLGEALGVTEAGTAARVASLLGSLGLPSSPPAALEPGAVLEATRSDKKARRGTVRYTLVAGVGATARDGAGGWTHEVPDEAVLAALGAGS